jgi:hypothetical protein
MGAFWASLYFLIRNFIRLQVNIAGVCLSKNEYSLFYDPHIHDFLILVKRLKNNLKKNLKLFFISLVARNVN